MGDYWFWRVSEGGLVEPYKSMGSAMPPWKAELTVPDRWAVIAYVRHPQYLGFIAIMVGFFVQWPTIS